MTSPHVNPDLLLMPQATHSSQTDILRLPTQQRTDFSPRVLTILLLQGLGVFLFQIPPVLVFVGPSLPSQTSVKCRHKEAEYLFHLTFKSSPVGL